MTPCSALSSCYEHSHSGAYTYMLMFLRVANGLKIVHSTLRPFLSFAPLVLQMPWLFTKLFSKKFSPDRKYHFQMRLGR